MSDMAAAREGGRRIKRILDIATAKQDISWDPYMPHNNPYMKAFDPFRLPHNTTTAFPKVIMEPKVVFPTITHGCGWGEGYGGGYGGYNCTYGYGVHNGTAHSYNYNGYNNTYGGYGYGGFGYGGFGNNNYTFGLVAGQQGSNSTEPAKKI